MNNKEPGLYKKYNIARTDGRSEAGQKHEKCEYFVLDLTHDAHAIPAIRAYAESCQRGYPQLAKDLMKIVDGKVLHVFSFDSGTEMVVAYDPEDALKVAMEFSGCDREDYCCGLEEGEEPFDQGSDDAILKIWFSEDDGPWPTDLPAGATVMDQGTRHYVSATMRAWADQQGRGWLCGTEF